MENMRTVAVNLNALNFFRIDIAADMVPAVNHQNLLACPFGFLCKHCSVQTGTDNQIIKHSVTSLNSVS